ncbi:MAG: hypothetical protein WD572_04570 [Gammaproteobacteria bacterium]
MFRLKNPACCLLLNFAVLFVAAAAQADEPQRIEALAFNCWICHSSSSDSPPALHSLDAVEIHEQLLRWQQNSTGSSVMQHIVQAFSAEELAALADYLASHPYPDAADSNSMPE